MVMAKKSEGCSNCFQNEESPLRDSKVVPKTAGHSVGMSFWGWEAGWHRGDNSICLVQFPSEIFFVNFCCNPSFNSVPARVFQNLLCAKACS